MLGHLANSLLLLGGQTLERHVQREAVVQSDIVGSLLQIVLRHLETLVTEQAFQREVLAQRVRSLLLHLLHNLALGEAEKTAVLRELDVLLEKLGFERLEHAMGLGVEQRFGDILDEEVGKRTTIDLGIHGLHPELIRMIGKMKYRSSYGQNLLQHARETANLAGIMASELGLNPKIARRAGLLHDIGKVPDDEPELPHAIIGMKLAEKFKEKPEVCNAIGAHHDEVEMTSLIAPIIQVCDAISGARPGARREVVESYIKRLKEMEDIALSYPGVVKTYAIQAGRELRVIVGADKLSDQESEGLSHDIAKKIQDEMTYPGQVKITVIRETRAVSYAK